MHSLVKLTGRSAAAMLAAGGNDLWNGVFILNCPSCAYRYAVAEQYSMPIEQDTKRPRAE